MLQHYKKLSGTQNLKRKINKQKDDEKSAKKMANFLIGEQRVEAGECLVEEIEENLSEQNENNTESKVFPSSLQNPNYEDIAKWPSPINSAMIDEIVIRGPINEKIQDEYPRNSNGHHFSKVHFQRVMLNGESYKRRWLVYSQSTDKIYCFCCKLFCQIRNFNLSKEGFNNWKHLSERLKSHETSPNHLRAIETWIDASKRLKLLGGVDKHLQRQINYEKMRWVSILERLIEIVLFLSGHNLSFRGSSNKLDTSNNGNFLGLVELLRKFDPVMIEHLRSITNKETFIHYCSKTIQNELINLLGGEIRKKILSMVKKAKYFSYWTVLLM